MVIKCDYVYSPMTKFGKNWSSSCRDTTTCFFQPPRIILRILRIWGKFKAMRRVDSHNCYPINISFNRYLLVSI